LTDRDPVIRWRQALIDQPLLRFELLQGFLLGPGADGLSLWDAALIRAEIYLTDPATIRFALKDASFALRPSPVAYYPFGTP